MPRCAAPHRRKNLEHLSRHITRPAITNERLALNRAEQAATLSRWHDPYRDVTAGVPATARRLVPRPRLHLIRFHGGFAPNTKLRTKAASRYYLYIYVGVLVGRIV
jgi:hypothetical protein